jgi:hypothetical protein
MRSVYPTTKAVNSLSADAQPGHSSLAVPAEVGLLDKGCGLSDRRQTRNNPVLSGLPVIHPKSATNATSTSLQREG